MISVAICVILFGQAGADLNLLAIAAVISAFFNSAAPAGLYPLIANYFPTEVRAGGTGAVVAIGRGGAVAGPVIAGYLLQANIFLAQVAILLSVGSIAAAVALWRLGSEPSAEAL